MTKLSGILLGVIKAGYYHKRRVRGSTIIDAEKHVKHAYGYACAPEHGFGFGFRVSQGCPVSAERHNVVLRA